MQRICGVKVVVADGLVDCRARGEWKNRHGQWAKKGRRQQTCRVGENSVPTNSGAALISKEVQQMGVKSRQGCVYLGYGWAKQELLVA